MNRFRNYVLTAAGFAILAMVAGVFSAGPAIAQLAKAALVKNVDEKGRVPWKESLRSTCPTFPCYLSFSQVPLGKRLIIEYFTGEVANFNAAGVAPRVRLHTNCFLLTNCDVLFPTATLPPFRVNPNSNAEWGFSSPLLAYAEELSVPTIILYDGGNSTMTVGILFSITGYLIDKSI